MKGYLLFLLLASLFASSELVAEDQSAPSIDAANATGKHALSATPSGRITAPPVSEMTEDQKALYDKESGTFSGPIGPRMPLINSAEVERAWDQLSAALAKSALPRNLRELAILTVAVTWRSEFEWYVHSPAAVRFGIDPSIVEAMRKGQEPAFTADDQRIVYRYATELQRTHQVSDDAYAAAWKLLGTKTLVDLTVLIGHYTSVSMTLNAHKVPIPDGVPRAF